MRTASFSRYTFFAGSLALLVGIAACKSSTEVIPTSATFNTTYLVADTAGFGSARIDNNLENAWGIAIGPTGNFWISSAEAGVSTIYDGSGAQKLAPVMIPSRDSIAGGTPTGQIYNATSDFAIPGGGASKFIFASEDGSLSAWSSGASAVRVATSPSTDAVYKGIAMASVNGANYLYVTNFKDAKIEVFDKNFSSVSSMSFSDPAIPANYAPFNIANIDGNLYVTYAKHKAPDNEDDDAGVGNGYVDVFTPSGTLVKRFASQGTLNSPWGLTKAPAGFGDFGNAILVGNFGDGRISAFDSTGKFLGQLSNTNNQPLVIPGLWALEFAAPSVTALNSKYLWFAAGPDDESHGAFGYVSQK